jgi:beta-galactosidase
MSIGIFAWAALEPAEDQYEFNWLDTMMDKLSDNGLYAILATPSGSKPAWLSTKYPETCRVTIDGIREPHGERHNHCRTSPIYREKCAAINTQLANRYQHHPALLMWHVSNEYNGGPCYCDFCMTAFRQWLRDKFNEDLDQLNHEWWTGFWSHTFTDWDQIRPTDPSNHGLLLDWQRFLTDQTIDFYLAESRPLRDITPNMPVTTNFMGISPTLNYWKFAQYVDVVSWDSYPTWHDTADDARVAMETAFVHDINRCMKGGQPFMLMESTPSFPSRRGAVKKRKRPGMNLLSSLQAVAHGSDTVQYFQWRMSRGGDEKFHGAVVAHAGHEHTRVFRGVTAVGQALEKMDALIGTTVPAETAIIFDWENRWAMEEAVVLGPNVYYPQTCFSHYQPFWEMGVPVDIIDETADFSGYKLVIAPMLYLLRAGIAGRIADFVRNGGTVVMTYWSGIVNENDLCYLGGFPGDGLREVFGIWDEEIDVLQPFDHNTISPTADNRLGLRGSYPARQLCTVIHAETAEVLATYQRDFYAEQPALTVNQYGAGRAYYIASRNDEAFHKDFYHALLHELNLKRSLETPLPNGISVQTRSDGQKQFLFVMNFNPSVQTVDLGQKSFTDVLTGQTRTGAVEIAGYDLLLLETE